MMQRKTFLASSATIVGWALFPFNKSLQTASKKPPATYTTPPYLKSGDTIGITSPAGFIIKKKLSLQVFKSMAGALK